MINDKRPEEVAKEMNQPGHSDPMTAFSQVHWPHKELAKAPMRRQARSRMRKRKQA